MMGLPNCREVAFLLSSEYARPRGGRRSLKIRAHLLICGACRCYERYLAWMRDNLPRAAGHGARLSQAQHNRIREALHNRLP